MHGMKLQRHWNLFKPVSIFLKNSIISLSEIIFILLNPVLGIPKLYPHYHLILLLMCFKL